MNRCKIHTGLRKNTACYLNFALRHFVLSYLEGVRSPTEVLSDRTAPFYRGVRSAAEPRRQRRELLCVCFRKRERDRPATKFVCAQYAPEVPLRSLKFVLRTIAAAFQSVVRTARPTEPPRARGTLMAVCILLRLLSTSYLAVWHLQIYSAKKQRHLLIANAFLSSFPSPLLALFVLLICLLQAMILKYCSLRICSPGSTLYSLAFSFSPPPHLPFKLSEPQNLDFTGTETEIQLWISTLDSEIWTLKFKTRTPKL